MIHQMHIKPITELKKGIRQLHLTLVSKQPGDSGHDIFETLTLGKHKPQRRADGKSWVQLNEYLSCHCILKDKNTCHLLLEEQYDPKHKLNFPALMMVPALLLDCDIVSEEQHALLIEELKNDPHIQAQLAQNARNRRR